MANKKKPAKPTKKAAKAVSRKAERSKGELSSEDLDSVAGGIMTLNTNTGIKAPIDAVKTEQKVVTISGGTLAGIKDLLL
jgi:hypothetical protein